MTSTYVNDLRLNEMATGDQSGSWGTVTNLNLELIGDAFGYGTRAIANASSDNITIADGTADADRAMYLKLTGGGQACTVTLLPNTVSKVWMMENGTSAALTFTQGSGANVIIPAGDTKIIASDGAGSGAVVYDVFASLSVVDLKVQDDLTVAGDIDLEGSIDVNGTTNLDVVDIDGAVQIDNTLSVGVNDTGYDVKFFGATSGKSWLWDESADSVIVTGNNSQQGTLTVGVDGTGYDVKFFGDTATNGYMLWDQSADDLILGGASGMGIGVVPSSSWAGNSVLQMSHGSFTSSSSFGTGVSTNLVATSAGWASNYLATGAASVYFQATSDGSHRFYVVASGSGGADASSAILERFRVSAESVSTPTAGTSNVRLGVNAGNSIASGGNYNTVVGDEAGTAITTGDYNVAVGYDALTVDTLGANSVAIGAFALRDQNFTSATNTYNVGVGYEAGGSITTGINNTLIGGLAGDALTGNGFDGSGNRVLGADQNVVVGYGALTTDTKGGRNVAIGGNALSVQNFTTAEYTYNTAIGANAGSAIAAVGAHIPGRFNTLIGGLAGDNITTGDSNIIIGHNLDAASATADGQLNIGGWIQGVAGKIGIGTAAPDSYLANELVVAAADEGGITLAASSTGHKQNIFFADGTSGSTRNRGNLSYDHGIDQLTMGTAAGNARFIMDSTGAATLANGLTLTDGNLVVADGHGIDFSATDTTASTNSVLDAYEEGTFTHAVTCGTSGTITVAGAYDLGSYIKVGNKVTAQGLIVMSAISSPVGILNISLPFAAANGTEREFDAAATVVINNSVGNTAGSYVAYVVENSQTIQVFEGDAATYGALSANQIQASSTMWYNVTYRAA